MSDLPAPDSSGDMPQAGSALDYAGRHVVQRDYAVPPAQPWRNTAAYCNAPLDPFFYFCLRCATPYKTVRSITGPERPMPITDGQPRGDGWAPHTWTVFWTYAAVVIGCTLVALPFELAGGERSPIFYLLSTVAIFVTTVIFTSIHWRPLSAQLKRGGFLHWEAWAGIASLIPLLLMNYSIHMLARKYGLSNGPELGSELPLPVGILVFCLFPAVTEEIAFRGLLQYWLEVSLTPTKALVSGLGHVCGSAFFDPLLPVSVFTVGGGRLAPLCGAAPARSNPGW